MRLAAVALALCACKSEPPPPAGPGPKVTAERFFTALSADPPGAHALLTEADRQATTPEALAQATAIWGAPPAFVAASVEEEGPRATVVGTLTAPPLASVGAALITAAASGRTDLAAVIRERVAAGELTPSPTELSLGLVKEPDGWRLRLAETPLARLLILHAELGAAASAGAAAARDRPKSEAPLAPPGTMDPKRQVEVDKAIGAGLDRGERLEANIEELDRLVGDLDGTVKRLEAKAQARSASIAKGLVPE